MNENSLDWNDLNLFLAVAREGGLSPATKVTSRSPATLGRRMLALERSLDCELFIRHERGYELTKGGLNLLAELEDIESKITRLSAVTHTNEHPLVKISAGTWTTLVLLEKLEEVVGQPEDVRVRFVSTEDILDIPRREVVIGFRNRRPTDNALACRRLARIKFAPYATTDAPRRWIKVLSDTPSARWLEKNAGNDSVCEVSAPRNGLDLAIAGKGIALLPTFIGDTQQGLDQVGDVINELTHDQWIVTHQDDRALPEVRRVIDRLCRLLEETPLS